MLGWFFVFHFSLFLVFSDEREKQGRGFQEEFALVLCRGYKKLSEYFFFIDTLAKFSL